MSRPPAVTTLSDSEAEPMRLSQATDLDVTNSHGQKPRSGIVSAMVTVQDGGQLTVFVWINAGVSG